MQRENVRLSFEIKSTSRLVSPLVGRVIWTRPGMTFV
jgi:hypothetical protein